MIRFLNIFALLLLTVSPALAQEDADAVLAEQAKKQVEAVGSVDKMAKKLADDMTDEAIDEVDVTVTETVTPVPGTDETVVEVVTEVKPVEEIKPAIEKAPIKEISDGDMAERLKLSKRMHEIWPMRRKIESALESISEKIEASERLSFKNSMRKSINFEALEEASIDAMADIFTEKELIKMIDFYGSKEGRSVSFKTGDYEEAIQPVMIKMLDKAILDNKLGAQKR